MIVPLIMMSSSMFVATSFLGETEAQGLVNAPYILVLLAVPIACLVWEILALKKISSKARAAAVWLLFAVGLAPSLVFNGYRFICLLYTSPSPRDRTRSRMPSSA